MPSIGAYGTAIDTGGKAMNLVDELNSQFLQFMKSAKAAAEANGGWSGAAESAFTQAQGRWATEAQKLSDALGQSSSQMAQNVRSLLEENHHWAKAFDSA